MSDLLLNVDNDYLDLAAELNIDINTITDNIDINTSKSSLNTYFTSLPKDIVVRRLNSASYQDSQEMRWAYPGQDDQKLFEQFEGVNGVIVRLQGVVLQHQAQLDHSYWDEANSKYVRFCNSVGYKRTYPDGSIKLIQALPENVCLKGVTEYGDPPNRPLPIVDKLGLVGKKGMTCSECIRAGLHSQEVEGKDRPVTCSPTGQLIFYVTGFTTRVLSNKGGKVTSTFNDYTVKELMDDTGFILIIPLKAKSTRRGIWDASTKQWTSVGYEAMVNNLIYKHSKDLSNAPVGKRDTIAMKMSPYFQTIIISIVPPNPEDKNPKASLNFAVKEIPDLGAIKAARKYWQQINPAGEINVLNEGDFSNTKSVGLCAAEIVEEEPIEINGNPWAE